MWKPLVLSVLIIALPCYAAEPSKNAAESAEKRATSRIVNVTVYQNNALVTREVDVGEGIGSLELVVTPLPPGTVNSSLYSEGTDGIRVRNVHIHSATSTWCEAGAPIRPTTCGTRTTTF